MTKNFAKKLREKIFSEITHKCHKWKGICLLLQLVAKKAELTFSVADDTGMAHAETWHKVKEARNKVKVNFFE